MLKNKLYNLLRQSEKYTKTDMVYLAKGGGWMSLGRVVSMTCAFLLSVAFANLLPKEVYGNYKYVISIVGLISLFTLSEMGTAVARSIARGKDGVLDLAIKTEIKWGILGFVTSLGLALYYWLQGNSTIAYAFLVVSIFAPFLNVYSLYAAILQGRKRFDLIVKYDLYNNLATFIFIIIVILLSKQVWILIIPFLLVSTVLQKIWFVNVQRKIDLNNESDDETVSYGKRLSALSVFSTIAMLVDQILVFTLLGPVQVAIYNFAIAPTEQLKGIFKMIGPLAMPKLAVQSKEVIKKTIFRKAWVYSIFVAVIVSLYIISAPLLYKIIFPQYLESVILTQIIAVSLYFSSATIFMTCLKSQMAQKSLYTVTIVNAIIEIILVTILILFFGLIGAILGKVFARIINMLSLAVLVKRI